MEDRAYILKKNTNKIKDSLSVCCVDLVEISGNIEVWIWAEYSENIDKLKTSIEILKSGDFSEKVLRTKIRNDCAPVAWRDLFSLKTYTQAKLICENNLDKLQSDFDNEDDEYTRLCLIDDINRYKNKLSTINEIILLATDFKDRILGVIPDFKDICAKLLQEHNKLQSQWQNEVMEREKRIAEKIIPKPAPDPTPSKLIKSLIDNQQDFLFSKLTENSLFLPTETDYKSFCFVFGNSIKPDKFIPLQWLQNKQLLRELITELKHPDIEITKNKYTLPAFFIDTKEKNILYLPTNKPKNDILSNKIVEISIKLRQTK